MVLPKETSLKEEKQDTNELSGEDPKPDDCMDSEYNVTVKIEIEGTEFDLENEFAVKNEVKNEFSGLLQDSVCYDKLIEYCQQSCSVCNEMFCESYSLLQHNLNHLELRIKPIDLINECKSCKKYFADKTALDRHVILTHKKGKNKVTLIDNENSTINNTLHQCKICGKFYTNYKNWHCHMKEVHGRQMHLCELCNRTFKSRRYLRNHMERHLKPKVVLVDNNPYPCDICPSILKSKNALRTHKRNCHSEKVPCPMCPSVLNSQSYLYSHMRRVHYDDGKVHVCYCGKSFRSPRYLSIHVKNNHEVKKILNCEEKTKIRGRIKKFKCDCGRAFASDYILEKHIAYCSLNVEEFNINLNPETAITEIEIKNEDM